MVAVGMMLVTTKVKLKIKQGWVNVTPENERKLKCQQTEQILVGT
jgi:hypothetical protein